jgi:hypothetical protein
MVILNAVKDLPGAAPERCFTSFSMTGMDAWGQTGEGARRFRVLSAQNPPTRLLLQKRKIRRAMLGILPDFAVEYRSAELMFYP